MTSHELLAELAPTLFAELRDADLEGGGLPRYVERELAAYRSRSSVRHSTSCICHDTR